jgi:hypothetical protein
MFSFLHIGRSRMTLTAAVAVLAASTAPGLAYHIDQRTNQAETRDPSGRVTTEASVINIFRCDGPAENEGQYFIYQYIKRPGFRAIQPPNWSSSIGGKEFATFEEAAAAACATVSVGPNDPL